MTWRRAPLLLTVVTLAALTACAPGPDPAPTPSGFSSEEEAFAAAEDTYRMYVEAVNDYYNGNQSNDPRALLTGSALEGEDRALAHMRDENLTLLGELRILSFTARQATLLEGATYVTATVCLDSSDRRVVNRDGGTVETDAEDIYALDVEFMSTRAGLLIAESTSNQDAPC
ncbi:hypothetical protein [Microbacterium album]|uniref:SnoaL-like domain-containing protein n=1 Tax=Microbacterium album TaxID=2053191 RepID=A0A917ML47_9MICO|nr:hypothetical protein [Microbacterium album]GGH40214.1 hypothetical protein GCM10010921_11960 [Microbacterium album]